MRFQNDTSFSDEKLMQIIQFVDPDGLLEYGGEIVICNTGDNETAGRFEPRATKYLEPRITIFTRHIEDESDLVQALAHELRHMWQYYHHKDSIFSDEKKYEKDAENYSRKMLKLWYDGRWDWDNLDDYKKKLRRPLIEG